MPLVCRDFRVRPFNRLVGIAALTGALAYCAPVPAQPSASVEIKALRAETKAIRAKIREKRAEGQLQKAQEALQKARQELSRLESKGG
jgi:hypothetical protein